MTVGAPRQPGQRETFEEAAEHARAHRAERISIRAHSLTRTPRPNTDSTLKPTTASTGLTTMSGKG